MKLLKGSSTQSSNPDGLYDSVRERTRLPSPSSVPSAVSSRGRFCREATTASGTGTMASVDAAEGGCRCAAFPSRRERRVGDGGKGCVEALVEASIHNIPVHRHLIINKLTQGRNACAQSIW